MYLVSLAQHSAWLGAAERPEKPSYSKRTARPQPRYMPACGAENGASTQTPPQPGRGGPSPLGPGPPSSDSQLVGRQGAWAAPSNALPSGPRQRGLRLNGVADKISERELVPLVPEERRPCRVRGKKGLAVSGQQPQDHLRDDPAADRTEAPLAAAGRGLGQDVVPQRRRCAVEPKVIVVQPRLAQGFGHVLTRWQSHGSAPHEVEPGEGAAGLTWWGDAGGQVGQRRGQLGIEPPGGLRSPARQAQEPIPVDHQPV